MNLKFLFALIVLLLPEISIGAESDKQDDLKIKLPSSKVLEEKINHIMGDDFFVRKTSIAKKLEEKLLSKEEIKSCLQLHLDNYLEFLLAEPRIGASLGLLNDLREIIEPKFDEIVSLLAKE